MKIYTKTGDKGTSSLYNGERRAKDNLVFDALGSVDELSSCIGIANEHCQSAKNGLEDKLFEIQCVLIEMGSNIATPRQSSADAPYKLEKTAFPDIHVSTLESWIDTLDAQLPALTNFILPSGGLAAVHLHQCRSVARRAERVLIPLVTSSEVDEAVGKYLNRLSDFFFVAARFAAKHEGKIERVFKQKRVVEREL
ncbi:cob(I)alamin adenosyltransferase [Catenaria anguillulae PL171]|uniref:Corrinoid adenosyltransferase MMAB n=1 Tax=Catenaria anguillulae PL171 TaxID=765915 RepID=A0A1Y2I391_9FUNG|nr:cob(I)alamin adenosyltransferase [Catenaria anguillulae PL171]